MQRSPLADQTPIPPRPARLDSRALLKAEREVIIEHDGVDYRLRLTSNGKLILTK